MSTTYDPLEMILSSQQFKNQRLEMYDATLCLRNIIFIQV